MGEKKAEFPRTFEAAPRVWSAGFIATCLIQALAFAALLRSPLFWAFHFEYAFVANSFLIVAAGGWTIASFWPGAGAFDMTHGLVRSLNRVGILAILPLLLAAAAQIAIGTCDALEGLGWYALLPGVGALFTWALAAACSLFARSRRRAIGFYVAIVAGFVSLFFGRLYFGISFRGFNWLLGYWPGVLYDEFVPIEAPLLWARGEALCLASAALVFIAASLTSRPRLAWLGLALFLACGGLVSFEDRMGIHPSRGEVANALGGTVDTKYVQWVVGGESAARFWPLLAARVDYQIERLAWELGIDDPPPLRIYLFDSDQQKRRFLGAQYTFVTRPWKGELYLHVDTRAHDVIRHELVHLLAAPWGVPVLKISPSVALLEGLARDLGDDWSQISSQQALAAAVFERMPDLPLERLLKGPGFWSFSPTLAYPAAGAFVEYLRSPGVLDESFEAFYARGGPADSRQWRPLIDGWRAQLSKIPLSDYDRAAAERMLAPRPLHEKRCAHEVAECVNLAAAGKLLAGTRLFDRAVSRALSLDPEREDIRAIRVRGLRLPEEMDSLRAALPELDSEAPLSFDQGLAADRYATELAKEERWEEAARWLELLARWPVVPHKTGRYEAAFASAQRGGESVLIGGESGGWELECRWEEGYTFACLEPEEDATSRPVERRRIQAAPQILYSLAFEHYTDELAHGDFAEAGVWAGRMAEIGGLDEELRGRARRLRDEAEWLAGNMAAYRHLIPR